MEKTDNLVNANTTAIRQALDEWLQGLIEHNAEKVLTAYSANFYSAESVEPIRAYLEQLQAQPDDHFSLDYLHITMNGTLAVAEPILHTTLRGCHHYRFVFQKETSGWRILTVEQIGSHAIEIDPIGPGAAYLELTEQWASANLAWVQKILREHPPNHGNPWHRQQALMTLDEPLHLRSAAYMAAIGCFFRSQVDFAIQQMEQETVTAGATLWKIYNHGWVVKTAHHGWAHDLVDGIKSVTLTETQIERILHQVEVIFCSHWHGDHSSAPVIVRALDKGIPVVVSPYPEAEKDWQMACRIHRILRANPAADSFTIAKTGRTVKLKGIQYHAFPGHQGELPNTLFLVSANGMSILHCGDQYHEDDLDMIADIGTSHRIDILLPIVWTSNFDRMIQSIAPRMIIPGHENELGHLFCYRGSYDESYKRLRRQTIPWQVLAWGERFHLDPE